MAAARPSEPCLQPQRITKALAVWGALITVYLVWGSTYLAIRFVVETMPPFTSAGARFLLAGLLLYLWGRARGEVVASWREWGPAAVAGTFLLLGGNGGVMWAEQRVPSGVAALIVGAIPLWITLLDALVARRGWPGPLATLGVALGFVGIGLLVGPAQLFQSDAAVDPWGALALVGSSLSWSVGSIYARGIKPSSPVMGIAMQMIAGGAVLAAAGLVLGEPWHWNPSAFSERSLLALAYLVVFGSLIGFSTYNWLLRHAPITLVSTYAYVNPLVAVLLGNLLGGEPITLRIVLAGTVIVGSVVMVTTGRDRRRRT
jgi:drug/metabolite transporter (DMT)-like permease